MAFSEKIQGYKQKGKSKNRKFKQQGAKRNIPVIKRLTGKTLTMGKGRRQYRVMPEAQTLRDRISTWVEFGNALRQAPTRTPFRSGAI